MRPDDGRNVLLVVLDTVRKDHLTPYGYDRATTPILERFARDARVYETAIAQAPWTLPVHASMFTGRYPSEHTATQESPYLPPEVGTLAEALAASGYRTACYSSNAWITPYTRLTAGFEEHDSFFEVLPGGAVPPIATALWRRLTDGRLRPLADRLVEAGNEIHERLAAGGNDSKTPAIIDRARAFLDDANGRWFAFLNLMDAHLPYYPPEPYRSEFAPGIDPDTVCQNSKAYNAGARSVPKTEFDSIRRLYDAEIRHMDAELGRLFEHLKRTDQWDETLVIVCADHGELHGEFGLYGHEFAVYDPLVTVPLLVKHPDIGTGRTDETVELLDIYDTILETAAATDIPGRVGGRPLETERSLLSDGRAIPDGEYAFVEYHRPVIEHRQLRTKAKQAGTDIGDNLRFDSRMWAARGPDVKYIHNERFPNEAYRLDDGLAEGTRIDPNGPVASELSVALDRFSARVGSPLKKGDQADSDKDGEDADGIVSEMGAAARQRLRDLGYLLL